MLHFIAAATVKKCGTDGHRPPLHPAIRRTTSGLPLNSHRVPVHPGALGRIDDDHPARADAFRSCRAELDHPGTTVLCTLAPFGHPTLLLHPALPATTGLRFVRALLDGFRTGFSIGLLRSIRAEKRGGQAESQDQSKRNNNFTHSDSFHLQKNIVPGSTGFNRYSDRGRDREIAATTSYTYISSIGSQRTRWVSRQSWLLAPPAL